MLNLAITKKKKKKQKNIHCLTASCLNFYIVLSRISPTVLLLLSLLIITMPPAHLTGSLLPFHLINPCQRMNTASSNMDSIMFPWITLKRSLKFVVTLRHFLAVYALNTIFRIRIILITLIPIHLLIYSQEPPPGHHLREKTSFLTRQYPNAVMNLNNMSNQTRHTNPAYVRMKFPP